MGHDRYDEVLETLQEQIGRMGELVDAMGQTEQPTSEEVVLTYRITHRQLRIPWRELMLWSDEGNPDCSLVGRGRCVYAVCESMNEVRMRVRAAKAEGTQGVQGVADPTPEQLREAAEGLAAEEEAAEPEPPQPGPGEIVLTVRGHQEPRIFDAARVKVAQMQPGSDYPHRSCAGTVIHVGAIQLCYWVTESPGDIQARVDAALAALAEAEPKTVTLPPYEGGHDTEWKRIDRIGQRDGESALRVEGRYRTSWHGWKETCFGLFCSLHAADITERVRKVWPKFSCPGCTKPFVVLHSYHDPETELSFTRVTQIIETSTYTSVCGDGDDCTDICNTVKESGCAIRVAALAAGVELPVVEEAPEPADAKQRGPDDEDDRCCRACSYYGQCDMADWRCRLGSEQYAKRIVKLERQVKYFDQQRHEAIVQRVDAEVERDEARKRVAELEQQRKRSWMS